MKKYSYPKGAFQELMETDLVTPITKQVFKTRSEKEKPRQNLFEEKTSKILRTVCDRLIPMAKKNAVDLAILYEVQLATGSGKGWRYAVLPPEADALRSGMAGLDETAQHMFDTDFCEILHTQQEQILSVVQLGDPPGPIWRKINARLFFEELLASLVEIYYSQPQGREEIGEVSFADASGWQKIGLNERENHEPEAYQS